ncbi:6-phosphogluconate dehydrogenase, decarboxylating [Arcticibacter svalbardensis MN12-7]|uniref:6-phosphogluconate dehydrogenase, decarboxylating n=1 Tax=Arcticibacter svalbardensis MN12-7 TaxID=1150600 RepID=R9GPJ9_9SPHI|nr:NADP-dependent phosphogluconate dehydrogenase [Arcticibacter svalbardensis]EOR93626.1 6-phosphogluconate dehydrogenase, decarboxylating [Arcticibacter svalbardensis MN12-7]
MEIYDFGMVGLGVMGRNLLLNMADNNFAVSGLDIDQEKADFLEKDAKSGQQVKGTISPKEFIESLKKPRALMLLVPAGKPVDAAIQNLLPFLQEDDIVIDGGNSHFTDTNRRVAELNEKGIHFFGMGISGGEKGARFGPSMMPGGDKEAYERLRPIFEAISAKVNNEPCVTYMGTGSAGHYVKMVHNGIEYAIMQLISEVYDLLKRGLNYSDVDLQKTFEEWNQGELQSYLLEITGEVLSKFDDKTGIRLVNLISDRAMAKGTGKWTSQNAMDLQSPIPVIDAAVTMRDLSTYKDERVRASVALQWNLSEEESSVYDPGLIDEIKEAYHFAMITVYAQGMAQLHKASREYNYGLNPENVTRIWRGGCIIRALCLEDFRQAFNRDRELPNLMLDEQISKTLISKQMAIRSTIKLAVDKGIPVAAFMTSLAYFDAYRSATLPTNLIQAQRDYFGAHLYERIDQEGTFHTHWDQQ